MIPPPHTQSRTAFVNLSRSSKSHSRCCCCRSRPAPPAPGPGAGLARNTSSLRSVWPGEEASSLESEKVVAAAALLPPDKGVSDVQRPPSPTQANGISYCESPAAGKRRERVGLNRLNKGGGARKRRVAPPRPPLGGKRAYVIAPT